MKNFKRGIAVCDKQKNLRCGCTAPLSSLENSLFFRSTEKKKG
jgi:hypothetical protein